MAFAMIVHVVIVIAILILPITAAFDLPGVYTALPQILADELGALRFSIDEWMVPLFGPDQPDPIRFDWMIERVNRCEAMIFAMVRQAATRGL